MTDRFDVQRKLDSAGDEITRKTRTSLEDKKDLERSRRARLVKLSPSYFFDPVEKVLLKKNGSQLGFVRHDRRYERQIKANQAEAEAKGFRLVAGGFFWDDKGKKLYRKSGKQYVLYSPDRRGSGGKNPVGNERRGKR